MINKNDLEELEIRFVYLLKKPYKTPEDLNEKEKVRLLFEKALEEDEQPLVIDLRKAGIEVNSVWDLVNSNKSYKAAIPVLLKHISEPYHVRNKEGIVRALATKEAKGVAACNAIIKEYLKAPKDNLGYRWAFGNTMAVIITDDCLKAVIDIVRNENNGESRQKFVTSLGKVHSQLAKDTLLKLINDKNKVISSEAQKVLKKLKATE